ncbi:MAG: DUF5666 domain-containing protein [Halofilum sp. (in: g-proteobacteria)]|nr:DUF5666 domain-containing protein [Halofilum sp. (in: g-proteobacteria)]
MEIELEGIVDNFTSEKIFTVSGVPVDASGATVVDEAGEPATVQPGAEVEVEGAFDANGTTLVADRIEVELEDNVEIVARVSADPGANGPIQLLYNGVQAVSVAVTDKTQLRDKSDMPVANFSVADLVVGDWIELDAFEDGSGDVTALEDRALHSDASSEEVERRGPRRLRSTDVTSSTILEVLGFDTSGADFEDFNEMTITISDIGQGDVVEVWMDGRYADRPGQFDRSASAGRGGRARR